MNALQWLSALNWIFALLYSLPLIVTVALVMPFELVLLAALVGLFVAAPHIYLALNIEKGRGRILQTLYAAVSLLNFPIGTAFGVFALMTVWGETYRHVFENPGATPPDEGAARPGRDFSAAADALDIEEAETPRAFALRLRRAGAPNPQVRARLAELGLEREDVELVMKSLAPKGTRPGGSGRS